MTETPILRLIVMLSIPTVISMLVTNIYNLVDTAFVGTLGTSASGAVGIVFGFMAVICEDIHILCPVRCSLHDIELHPQQHPAL